MPDQMNEFDQLFRDRLGDQTATPPPAVWDNIQSTRTFGHVVANRISNNWRIFGTLLMLLLAGGSSIVLFGEEENNIDQLVSYSPRELQLNTNNSTNETTSLVANSFITTRNTKQINTKQTEPSIESTYLNMPEADILVSLQSAGFGLREVKNERLAAYIRSLNGWEVAKPIGFTHYFNMNKIASLEVFNEQFSATPKTVEIDYDYVMPSVERKTFKERSSLVLSITPQSIFKTLRAEYNMSSQFLENRKKAEKTRLAYSANALLHYEIKNNKFIETGISFTQIYEEVSFDGEKRFSNKYNFVEIPFLMGFEDRNSKWGWHIKGGFGLQFYNTYKGYTLKRLDQFGEEEAPLYRKTGVEKLVLTNNHKLENNQSRSEVVDLEDENENPYKTSGVVNLHIASGLTYFHSDKISFLITPSYKRSINSITKNSANFNEKISYTGISFGTMVKF